jgi:rhodanese-related sulfurtransferase
MRAIDAIREGAIVLDVRTSEEFEAGNLPNALNIPYNQLERRLGELNGQVDSPIVVYCKSGRRAGIAKKILEDHQFNHVWNGGGYLELSARSGN